MRPNPSPDSRSVSQESLEAFASGDKQRMCRFVFEYFRSCHQHGSTADEACAALSLNPNQVAPRIFDLWQAGLLLKVVDTDGRPVRRETRLGCSARVYIARLSAASTQVATQSDSASEGSGLPSHSSLFGDLTPTHRDLG
jgi:hypothetical protein